MHILGGTIFEIQKCPLHCKPRSILSPQLEMSVALPESLFPEKKRPPNFQTYGVWEEGAENVTTPS